VRKGELSFQISIDIKHCAYTNYIKVEKQVLEVGDIMHRILIIYV